MAGQGNMTLPASSPRDGAVIAAAMLLGPMIGTALLAVPWLAFAVFAAATEGNGPGAVAEAAAGVAGLGALALVFGFVLGAVPAALAGMIYAGMRRALGERADVAALSALMIALPVGLFLGVSGGGLRGFLLVVIHFVLTAILTWGAATALRRRRAA